MRIAINCRSFLKPNPTGIGRYARNLVESLLDMDHDNIYLLYARKRPFDFKRRLPGFEASNAFPIMDYLGRGVLAVCRGADLYHAPSPEFLPAPGCPSVVTVHDLIYKTCPQGHTPETVRTSEEQMRRIVGEAAAIICSSRSTAADLKRFFAVDNERLHVVYQGVDKTVFYKMDDADREKFHKTLAGLGVREPFIFFAGTREPRKNLDGLLEAFRLLKQEHGYSGRLVIAGMRGWMNDDWEGRLKQKRLEGQVTCLGYVTDGELCGLYNLADVFVFPSLYEGFGFPIVEAMACGAAVVTSSTSSCGEIAGEAALTVHPEDITGLCEKMRRVVTDTDLRNDLRRRAGQRAGDFSFRKTAQETLAVYREVCPG